MSWYQKARNVVARFGSTAGTAIKHVAGVVPGGSIVGELLETALHRAADSSQNEIDAETALQNLATANDLERLAAIFEECLGRLSKLVESVQLHEDEPTEAIRKLIVTQLATDQQVRDGFAQLGLIVQRFDRVEAKLDQVLLDLGYDGELRVSMRLLLQQQSASVTFFEEVRAAGVTGKLFAEAIKRMTGVMDDIYDGRAKQAAATLGKLEQDFPLSSAVVEAEAIQLVLVNEPVLAGKRLGEASKRRPSDERLAELSRRVTLATGGPGIDTDSKRKPSDWREHFRVGADVHGWTVTARLGEGGMGSVYRIEQGKQIRAMKVLPPTLSGDPVLNAQFRKEIVILAGLGKLANVVQYHDWNKHDASGCWYFHMEYVEGESLQTRIDRTGKPLDLAKAVEIIRQVSGKQGLTPLHEKGQTHRDVKPGNVMLAPKDVAKLVDFGIAGGNAGLTEIKAYTARFAAPEQLQHVPLTTAADVYSLVATLWYSVTRTYPADYDVDELPENLEALREVFTRGLDPRPRKRIANAAALTEMLDKIDFTATPRRVPVPTTQEVLDAERDERMELWKRSGMDREWVLKHLDGWNSEQWMALIDKLKSSPYWPLKAAEIGEHLETLQNKLRTERDQKAQAQREAAEKAIRDNPFHPARKREPGEKVPLMLPGNVPLMLAWCPPGEFTMGSDRGEAHEKPMHRVKLTRGFYLGVHPVTQAQWKAVMGSDPSHFKGADRPVEQVSWTDAQQFCAKLNVGQTSRGQVRLPTEAEWEYACRAGTTTDYHTGNGEGALQAAGWYDANSGTETHPVGQLEPNNWGLFDVHGNVWEWCNDWFGDYPSDQQTDPAGPASGSVRVDRGGGWDDSAAYCRSAYRDWRDPTVRFDGLGFRVALVLKGV